MALLADHRRSLKEANMPTTTPADTSPDTPSTLSKTTASPVSSESGDLITPIEVLYFTHPGCSACIRQNEVLRGWLKDRKDVNLKVITYGQSQELWERHSVSATPTMIFGVNGRVSRLVGLKTEDQLDTTVSSLKSKEVMPKMGRSKSVKPRLEKGEKK